MNFQNQRLAIHSIIFFALKIIRANWILLPTLYFTFRDSNFLILLAALLFLSFLIFLISLLHYLNFRFSLHEGSISIQSGILIKKNKSIQYDRIQSVHLNQKLLYQALSVAELEIETAGSSKKEVRFTALKLSDATQIKERLLSSRSRLEPNGVKIEQHKEEDHILQLGFPDFIKIGLSSNQIFLVIASIFGLFNYLSEQLDYVDIHVDEQIALASDQIQFNWFLITIVVLLLILIITVLSIAGSFLKFFDFKLSYLNQNFHKSSGLFTRKEEQFPIEKLQVYVKSQNLIQSFFKIFRLRLKQASSNSQENNGKQTSSFTIPLIDSKKENEIKQLLFPSFSNQSLESIDMRYFFRMTLFIALIPALLLLSLCFLAAISLYIPLLYFILISSLLYLRSKRWKYAQESAYFLIQSGILGFKQELFETHRIQHIRIRQSPYQRRNKLATIQFALASNSLSLPYVSMDFAERLRDELLYHIENSSKKWI